MKNTDNQTEIDDGVPVRSSATSSQYALLLTVATVLSLAVAYSPSRSFEIFALQRGRNPDELIGAHGRRKVAYSKASKSLGPKPCAAKQHYRR